MNAISYSELRSALAGGGAPVLLDVRRKNAYRDASEVLTGALRPSTQFAADDWRSNSPDFTGDTFRRNLAVVDDLKRFAADHDLSLPALAIAWTLANPTVDAAIVGTRNPAHLTDSVRAVDVRLSDQDLAELDRILARSASVRGPAPEAMPPS